ncbi:MAG TPA: lactate utilization protein [Actinomycetota bacterium]|nr:lactate utilization protein [Actinomycetota bacterium]
MERSEFLRVVRERLRGGDSAGRGRPPDGPAALPEEYPPTPVSGPALGPLDESATGLIFERFAEALAGVGGQARLVGRGELPEAVAAVARGSDGAAVHDLGELGQLVEQGLARAGCSVLPPGDAEADLGITSAILGVAATGSVLVSSAQGHRATALLPPTHLVLLPADRLVPGFGELCTRLEELCRPGRRTPSSLVLVTGPSRTSDIEMTPVLGVHGPGQVIVLVISA